MQIAIKDAVQGHSQTTTTTTFLIIFTTINSTFNPIYNRQNHKGRKSPSLYTEPNDTYRSLLLLSERGKRSSHLQRIPKAQNE